MLTLFTWVTVIPSDKLPFSLRKWQYLEKPVTILYSVQKCLLSTHPIQAHISSFKGLIFSGGGGIWWFTNNEGFSFLEGSWRDAEMCVLPFSTESQEGWAQAWKGKTRAKRKKRAFQAEGLAQANGLRDLVCFRDSKEPVWLEQNKLRKEENHRFLWILSATADYIVRLFKLLPWIKRGVEVRGVGGQRECISQYNLDFHSQAYFSHSWTGG